MRQLKVALKTVGCRANQADTALLLRGLDADAVNVVEELGDADLVVINTCCVTAEAERDCRKIARRALRASEKTRVLLIGCAVNAFAEFGRTLGDRVEVWAKSEGEPLCVASRINELAEVLHSTPGHPRISSRVLGRTRAFLKIQTGCSHCCSYCIVPRARGPERSMTKKEIFEELFKLEAEGFSEIVLAGVQLGAWGSDLPRRPRLTELVVAIADRLAPSRLRLSSLEPWSVDDALIDAVAHHDRICSHFHIPLQSGDDGILRAMGRGYTARDYLNIAARIRRTAGDAALGTDVLLGFPGEDERAFARTMEILREIEPSYIHAFSYSKRRGARAALLPDQIAPLIVKERTRIARAEGTEMSRRFQVAELGKVREVIIEEQKGVMSTGLTDNFISVAIKGPPRRPGELFRARLDALLEEEGRVLATVV